VIITWDNAKRLANLDKHGLDFADLDLDFFLDGLIVPAQGRRLKAIGRLKLEAMIAVVFAPLGTKAISIAPCASRARGKGACSVIGKTKALAGRGYTQADWDDVSDNPEWTAEEMAKAKPFAEVFPELAASARRARGKQKAPTKQLVSLRLDRSIVDAFKAEGPGWQTRMNEALKRAIRSR
jgi:uncharacterized protein (DUF4415 family)/uncharacterized DUF497 family protein